MDTVIPIGTVEFLHLCVGHRKSMDTRNHITALAGIGLQGDRHAIPNSLRQVLIIDLNTLDHFGLKPGQVRENITVSGLDIHKCLPGQLLQIGENVILAVTGLCEPCSRMDEIRGGLQRKMDGKRGVLAFVVHGGPLHIGDHVQLRPGINFE